MGLCVRSCALDGVRPKALCVHDPCRGRCWGGWRWGWALLCLAGGLLIVAPGPSQPLYFAGVVLTECSLVVTAAGGVGLGVAALAGHAGAPSQTVTYLGADASSVRRLDMWLVPEGAGARGRRHPAVVLVHGGGWDQGSRGGSLLPGWLAGRGYVVFDIDYRLATPTSPSWQQATGDVKCAVGWVNDHAARFGVDPERIALLGSSAGGHLACWPPTAPPSRLCRRAAGPATPT